MSVTIGSGDPGCKTCDARAHDLDLGLEPLEDEEGQFEGALAPHRHAGLERWVAGATSSRRPAGDGAGTEPGVPGPYLNEATMSRFVVFREATSGAPDVPQRPLRKFPHSPRSRYARSPRSIEGGGSEEERNRSPG
jgi:hypothetical protein